VNPLKQTRWFGFVLPVLLLGCSYLTASSDRSVESKAGDTASVAIPQDVEIVAHRGASFDAPENTLASVNLAWKQQTDAVEIDVYLSADQRIVVVHDKTLKRYGGPDKPIANMTYAELKKHEVGGWKDEKWRGEPIPLLSDVLKTIPEGKRLFIEIKCGVEIMPHLVKVLKTANLPPERTAIICFSSDVIAAAAEQLPELKRYWLASLKAEEITGKIRPTVDELIATAKTIGSDGLDLGGKLEIIDQDYVARLNEASLVLYVWTVNAPEEAARLSKLGAKGITTDRPALLKQHQESPAE